MQFQLDHDTQSDIHDWPCALCNDGRVALGGLLITIDGPPTERNAVSTDMVCPACLQRENPTLADAVQWIRAAVRVATDAGIQYDAAVLRLRANLLEEQLRQQML